MLDCVYIKKELPGTMKNLGQLLNFGELVLIVNLKVSLLTCSGMNFKNSKKNSSIFLMKRI